MKSSLLLIKLKNGKIGLGHRYIRGGCVYYHVRGMSFEGDDFTDNDVAEKVSIERLLQLLANEK